MGDNQQQLVVKDDNQRSAGDILKIGAGGAVIGLGFLWGLKALFPEWFEKGPGGGLG